MAKRYGDVRAPSVRNVGSSLLVSGPFITVHTSTGAVIRFVVVDTGLYLSLGAERRALRLIQFSTIWGSKLQNQFNLIWYGLTRFTKVNGLI